MTRSAQSRFRTDVVAIGGENLKRKCVEVEAESWRVVAVIPYATDFYLILSRKPGDGQAQPEGRK